MLNQIRNTRLYATLARIRCRVLYNKINSEGFKTNSKIIVIESDDWGSIRTPSSKTLERLVNSGDTALNDSFLRNDSLESQEDIEMLFDVLSSIRDSNGRALPITANFAMANANFEEIRRTGEYHRELFYDTYERYYGSKKVLDLVFQGIDEKIFLPQLHCLEHLNVSRWFSDLKNGKNDVVKAFDNEMYGIGATFSQDNKYGYMDAFNYFDSSEQKFLSESINKATSIFKDTFKYQSESFVASCYIWDSFLEKELKNNDIYHIQSSMNQILPFYISQQPIYETKKHYMGENNSLGQFYTIRNCTFEPSLSRNIDYHINSCLIHIKSAFENRAPAILSTHRLNFIGSISKENRAVNLDALRILFKEILKKYPDVIFMTSDQLGEFIRKG